MSLMMRGPDGETDDVSLQHVYWDELIDAVTRPGGLQVKLPNIDFSFLTWQSGSVAVVGFARGFDELDFNRKRQSRSRNSAKEPYPYLPQPKPDRI